MSKQGYHHGNLREALVQACIALIEQRGPQGFTLSEAAREAGVTPAAVYRHFEGREDLIAEAARQGYEIFGDLMEFAYNKGQPSALAAFEATGRAYLAFARKYPGHYVAMFESGISIQRTPELNAAATRAMGPVPTHSRRQTPTAADVFGAYLGHVTWRGGAVRTGQTRQ
jgi:AcrR family transcriptional regulator